ncbi:MAG: CCA tRNA nucleotidyltransferase [Chloroflexi bacterium]|nr:CCA tRNA nucleotidyltransferase [Chloroflexota bacterium]MYD49107.1 CCA tRNA nucleotidyltransferase [Chloroflexota bacterium]
MLADPDASTVGIFLNADAPIADLLRQVQKLAGDSGVSAYLVGGPVRDHLLGAPIKDLDIAVVGSAPSLAEKLADTLGGRVTVHPRFHTATVYLPGGLPWVDLVTARRETYSRPGALPDVTPGTIADDLARRDFTINAMAIPLCGDNRDLVDPHNGRADLAAGVIRTLHPNSFLDDPTRMFRAVRYEQRFGFRIDDATLTDMQSALASGAMVTLSGPRIDNELGRIVREPSPLPALRRATELGLLAAIHPAMPTMAHWDALAGWSSVPPGAEPADREWPICWDAALFWTLDGEQVASLAMKNPERTRCARYVDLLKPRLPFLAVDGLTPSNVCALLENSASSFSMPFTQPAALTVALAFAEPTAAQNIRRYLTEWQDVKPLLDGSDLLALGVPEGPAVGELLEALRNARLDRETRNRRDERFFVLRRVSC